MRTKLYKAWEHVLQAKIALLEAEAATIHDHRMRKEIHDMRAILNQSAEYLQRMCNESIMMSGILFEEQSEPSQENAFQKELSRSGLKD